MFAGFVLHVIGLVNLTKLFVKFAEDDAIEFDRTLPCYVDE